MKSTGLVVSAAFAACCGAALGQEITVIGRLYLGPCSGSSTGNCYVDVRVDASGTTCEVKLDSAAQEVVGITNANFMLWRIVSPPKGWIFTTDGVAIHDNWHRDFTNPKLAPDSMAFVWKNKRTVRKTYKYAVTVTDAATEAIECTLDPWIKNQ